MVSISVQTQLAHRFSYCQLGIAGFDTGHLALQLLQSLHGGQGVRLDVTGKLLEPVDTAATAASATTTQATLPFASGSAL